jgi:hypothetical protein
MLLDEYFHLYLIPLHSLLIWVDYSLKHLIEEDETNNRGTKEILQLNLIITTYHYIKYILCLISMLIDEIHHDLIRHGDDDGISGEDLSEEVSKESLQLTFLLTKHLHQS